MRRVALHIFGQVQGIGFRYSARREALKLGLSGFVRNEMDGSVYAEAEGLDEKVGAFIRWCRRGPLNAVVWDVKTEEMIAHFDTPDGLLNERFFGEGFEIRY